MGSSRKSLSRHIYPLVCAATKAFQLSPLRPREHRVSFVSSVEPERSDDLGYSIPTQWLSGEREHNLKDMQEYRMNHFWSLDDPETFWSVMAAGFEWHPSGKPVSHGKFKYNFDPSNGDVFVEWLKGSRTNIAFNALDRQISLGRGDQVALMVERHEPEEKAPNQPNSYTYSELCDEVNRLANALKKRGVKKGDRVVVFMGHGAEAIIAMLASSRIGSVHCVVFGGFSSQALAQRIIDSGAIAVITQDGYQRGTKVFRLKDTLDNALSIVREQVSKEGIDISVIVHSKLDASVGKVNMGPSDTWWDEAIEACEPACSTEWVDAEHPAFILYTSGSTGKPKGIVHATGGYMVGAAVSFKYVFDVQPGDVWWCTADVGWITGHSYVAYGPLLNGATQVLFEGSLFHPTAARAWQIVDKYQVSHLYTAPTFIRSCMSLGESLVQDSSSRESLRLLGSVGEPINPEAWRFYFDVIGKGKCPIVDTWWQTETGQIMLTPFPVPQSPPLAPGAASFPFFGADPAILDPVSGVELGGECEGLLVFKSAWPSALRGVWGDEKRFRETYFKQSGRGGVYVSGDRARRDHKGQYWITGRADDVMVVSGHNIGTAEVESAAVEHPLVGEAAAVGVPNEIKGTGVYLFASLVDRAELPGHGEDTMHLSSEIKKVVKDKLGAFARPDKVQIVPSGGLPKTRSGKIMRRILKKVAVLGNQTTPEDMGDTSTLADPSVVDVLIASSGEAK